jgi:23S rRNA pseudouridine955/2504/2580 synthase
MQANKVRYVEVDEQADTQRIDNFLLKHLKGVPRTHVYRLLRKGEVRVNSKRIGASYRLKLGDRVRIPPVTLKAPQASETPSASLTLCLKQAVLYDDDAMMIVNKPSGLAVHGGSGVNVALIESMRQLYPQYPALELVHRLDRETSGCLVLAKKRAALCTLHEAFRQGEVKKTYRALVKGHWDPHHQFVDLPLQRDVVRSGERMVQVSKKGKASSTRFKSIESYADACLVEATLLTGRTHQIRVHAAHSKHPVAGDSKYGDKTFNASMRKQGLKRLFLHAYRLTVCSPATGEGVTVQAPCPRDLQLLLEKLGQSNSPK